MRSPRARAGRSRRAEPEPDAARSMEVATTALGMNGLGRQARPISSTSAITSSTEPPLPPSTGGIRSPGQPRVAIAFQRSWAKPAGSRASAWTRSGGQCCWRKARAVWLRSCCWGVGANSISLGACRRNALAKLGARLVGGKPEAARGDGRAQDLGGAAGDGLAEARLVEMLDLPAELGPARSLAQRSIDAEHLHAEGQELLPGLVGHDLGERRLRGHRHAPLDHPPRAIEEEGGDVGGDLGEPPSDHGIA